MVKPTPFRGSNPSQPLPEKVLTEKLDSARVGFNKPRLLDWIGDGRVMLAGGKVLLNADTGDTLAILDAGKIHAQAAAGEATAILAHGDFATLEGLAVISLNEARFPEKAGQPNRASPAPVR